MAELNEEVIILLSKPGTIATTPNVMTKEGIDVQSDYKDTCEDCCLPGARI
jgi:hypothetical protein